MAPENIPATKIKKKPHIGKPGQRLLLSQYTLLTLSQKVSHDRESIRLLQGSAQHKYKISNKRENAYIEAKAQNFNSCLKKHRESKH
jgi:hypothetical protein